jgi:adenine-specific DNA-methyltransferase
MYERLLLLKELLGENGSIFIHCDQRRNYHLRCLMNEIFGENNFKNEIIREKQRGGKHHVHKVLGSIHDTVYHYSKSDGFVWHHLRKNIPDRVLMERYPYEDETGRYALADCRNFSGIDRPNLTYEFLGFRGTWKWTKDEMLTKYEQGEVVQTKEGNVPRRKVRPNENGDLIQSLWYDVPDTGTNKEYPTEKSEELIERIIGLSTDADGIVLDCFIGSGTTAAVAQKLGRRWIGCDINKGAIQTTAKRLQTIIAEQRKTCAAPRQQSLDGSVDAENDRPLPAQLGFTVWRVNDYDLQIQHNEAVNLACDYIGVERKRSDAYFDGILGKGLVKIVPFTHPLSPLDLDELQRELKARPDEDRDIVLICLGVELAAQSWLEDWNRHRETGVPNRVDVIELRTDPKYAGFIKHDPATARVTIARRNNTLKIKIEDFISPTIIKRLDMEQSLFKARIKDWRSQVDCIMIDTDFDGQVFNAALSDAPAKKSDLVSGEYELAAPAQEAEVAVRIIDMLGEEVLVVKKA